MPEIPLLALKDATVVRAGKPILNQLTFDLWEGEHVAILGPNGAGKSTLLKLIDMENRPLAQADPAVKVLGQDRWDVSELRKIIGIVTPSHLRRFEEAEVDVLTCVLAGFFCALELYPHMVVTPKMRLEAMAALGLVHADHLAERTVSTLSTGEGRRVLIARALALEPRALLLDEPTAGLDLAAASDFLAVVRRIAQSGRTVILVTHHVEEIIPEVTRVLLLKSGALLFDGTKEHALTDNRLSELYEVPVGVRTDGEHFRALRKGFF